MLHQVLPDVVNDLFRSSLLTGSNANFNPPPDPTPIEPRSAAGAPGDTEGPGSDDQENEKHVTVSDEYVHHVTISLLKRKLAFLRKPSNF